MPKTKVSTSNCPATRGVPAAATIASKLARMATASPDASDSPGLVNASPDILSTDQLVSELEKQRASLLKDMSTLILESAKPLQSSMDALRETVNHFNNRLVAAETLAGDNFERITSMEKTVKMLEAQNKSLQDRLDDLENRSRRVNLRIINIPEGSERGRDPTEFISDLLMENLGAGVLTRPPELERSRRKCFVGPGNTSLSTTKQRSGCTQTSAPLLQRNEPLSTKSSKLSTRKELSSGFSSLLVYKFHMRMNRSLLILRRTRTHSTTSE